MNRLLSTNWLLATPDGKNVGLVPVNYIRRPDLNHIPPGETADVTMEPVLINSNSHAQGPVLAPQTTKDSTIVQSSSNDPPPIVESGFAAAPASDDSTDC